MKFIYNFISSILKKTSLETSLKKDYVVNLSNKPDQAIESVLNATGEVSSLVYSEHILSLFAEFDDQQKINPIYKTLSGWKTSTKGIRNMESLQFFILILKLPLLFIFDIK